MGIDITRASQSLFDSEGDWAFEKPYLSASLYATQECYLVDKSHARLISLDRIERYLLDLDQALQSQEWQEDFTVSANVKELDPVASHLFLRVYRRAEADALVNYVPHFEDRTMEVQWNRSLRETKYPPLERRFKIQRIAYDHAKAKTIFQRLQQNLIEDKTRGKLCHFVYSPYYEHQTTIRGLPLWLEIKDFIMIFLGSAFAVGCFLNRMGR